MFINQVFCNQSFLHNVHQVNTTLSLAMNAGMMMTNLKAELPSYGTVWFDPQPMTNVLSFVAKQYPIQYLRGADTFQVQLCNCINIFAMNRLITSMFWKVVNPERNLDR